MTVQAAAIQTDVSVYRNNSRSHWTKLDNQTLRTRLDGDPLTAGRIWRDALTCQSGWLFTTPNIAKRHNVSEKTAQRLLTRCVKNGVAKRLTVKDPTTGRFLMHHFIFFENPVDKIRPPVKPDKSPERVENKENAMKSPVDKICPPVSFIKKEQKKDQKEPIFEQTPERVCPPNKSQPKKQKGSFLKINFGNFKDSIDGSCKAIDALPKKKLRFNPWCAAIAAAGEGAPPEAIDKTLQSMIRDWDKFDISPFGIFIKRLARQNGYLRHNVQMRNEKESIDEHCRRNIAEKEFCESGFAFNNAIGIGV